MFSPGFRYARRGYCPTRRGLCESRRASRRGGIGSWHRSGAAGAPTACPRGARPPGANEMEAARSRKRPLCWVRRRRSRKIWVARSRGRSGSSPGYASRRASPICCTMSERCGALGRSSGRPRTDSVFRPLTLGAVRASSFTVKRSDDGDVASSDSALLRRAREGDPGALDELVALHQSSAFRVALGILGDEADAQDAAQDGMLRALKGLAKFRGDASFRTWLLAIVANEARSLLRRRARRLC